MAKKKQSILDKMFHVFVNDEDTTPEDIKEAAEAVNDLEEETNDEAPTTEDPTVKAIQDALKPIMDRLEALEATKDSDDEEEDLDDDEDEDFLTDADEGEDGEVKDEDGEASPEEIAEHLDHDTVAYMLKAIRPQIARMPAKDSKAITKTLNQALKRQPTTDYDKLLNHVSKTKTTPEKGAFGEACRSRNPHYKGGNK